MSPLALAAGLGLMSFVVTIEAAWLAESLSHDARFRRALHPRLVTLLRLAFLVGLPYVGLISGLIPARYFGLTGLEQLVSIDLVQPWPDLWLDLQLVVGTMLLAWQPVIGPVVLIGLSAALLLSLGLWLHAWLQGQPDSPPVPAFPTSLYASTLDLLLDAVHWAFYRALFWLLTDRPYLGVWGGLIVVAIELAAISYFSKSSPLKQQQNLWRVVLATVTAVCFFFTPDFWLILALHFGLAWLLQSGLARAAYLHLRAAPSSD